MITDDQQLSGFTLHRSGAKIRFQCDACHERWTLISGINLGSVFNRASVHVGLCPNQSQKENANA